MDFRLTPEQEKLKAEFDAHFKEEAKRAPKGWFGGFETRFETDENWAYYRSVIENVAKKGWLSLPWPKQYGGRELGYLEQALFSQSAEYHRVPAIDVHLSIVSAGMLEYASDEMKQEWLPRMAKGEIDFAQCWSEPDAGSDLASLTTKAVEDGDEYVINGQKVWTTGAHRANHLFILARTDTSVKPNKGLTYFLSEIDKPGISIRPVYYMNGGHVCNETFFDDLRVPKKNIVGEVNQGWKVTMAGANFERSGAGGVAAMQRDMEDLVDFCKHTYRRGQALGKDPVIQHKLADLAVKIEAMRQWAYFCAWQQTINPMSYMEPSASKYYMTELMVELSNTGLEIMGLYGTLKQGSKWAALKGKFEEQSQITLGFTIAGGTSETQKNIIAWYGLWLPRMK